MQPEKKPRDESNQGEQTKYHEKTVGVYGVNDLLKAPLKPPEPVETEPPEMTYNKKVRFLIIIAIALFIIGLLLLTLFSGILGIIILILAAILAAVAVFAPLQ